MVTTNPAPLTERLRDLGVQVGGLAASEIERLYALCIDRGVDPMSECYRGGLRLDGPVRAFHAPHCQCEKCKVQF